jgi:hypothetical protein
MIIYMTFRGNNKEWIFKWNRVENRESDVSVLKSGKLK